MAPLPKKRHAKSRSKIRRAAATFRLPRLVTCSNCQNFKLPHLACPKCGFRGKNEKEK